MNTKNFDYLSTQVFYTGFGPDMEKELEDQLKAGKDEFTLRYSNNYGKDEAVALLHFKKSAKSDLYFFNSYDLSLKQGHKEGQEQRQTFFIGKENNITMKEAYNLLSGRAINKEWTRLEKVGEGPETKYQATGEKYHAWLQLDFKDVDERGNYKALRYFENYDFDLKKALSSHPIKGMDNAQDMAQLMDSLKKGNRQMVVLMDGDSSKQYFMEANPRYKSVDLYDQQMKKIILKQEQEPAMVEEQKAALSTSQKKETALKDGTAADKDVRKERKKGLRR